MKKFCVWKIVLATAMLVMAYASVALAGMQDFYLVNNTGYTIYQVNVSSSGTDSWEEDILGSQVLENGESLLVNFGSGSTQYWDIQAIFEDGSSLSWYGIDLLSTYQVTLNYDGTATLE